MKYKKTVGELEACREVFQELDSCVESQIRQQWAQQEDLAIANRGDFLKIYGTELIAGEVHLQSILG
jgi:hypothetical protein